MTPEQVEDQRKLLREVLPENVANELCELALDGLRFRVWCEGASNRTAPGIGRLAQLLAKCITPQMYREAIDKFIVEGIRRR